MNLDLTSLLASFVVSSIGFVLFVYGKKMSRVPQLAVGLVLLVFPYFMPTVLPMLLIATVLLASLWWALQRGY
jgi:hypothetical protein